MAKDVYVTGAQKSAARMIVERSSAQGKTVSKSVGKIANASVRSAAPKQGSKSA